MCVPAAGASQRPATSATATAGSPPLLLKAPGAAASPFPRLVLRQRQRQPRRLANRRLRRWWADLADVAVALLATLPPLKKRGKLANSIFFLPRKSLRPYIARSGLKF